MSDAAANTAPVEIEAPPVIQVGKFPFSGKIIVPFTDTDEEGKGRIRYRRTMTYPPGTIVLGAPRRAGVYATIQPRNKRQAKRVMQCKPTRFIVYNDGSLRRQDKLILKHFKAMTPEQRTAYVQAAIDRAQAAPLEEAPTNAIV